MHGRIAGASTWTSSGYASRPIRSAAEKTAPKGEPEASQNGYIDSFNGRLRDELLNTELFFTLAEARDKLEHWHHDYNTLIPHSTLGVFGREPIAQRAESKPKPSPAIPPNLALNQA